MIYLMMQKNGMGNQMFVYAFGRCLQELYSGRDGQETIAINPYRFEHGDTRDYIDERRISLQHFVLNEHVCFLNYSEQVACNRRERIRIRLADGIVGYIAQRFFHVDQMSERVYRHRAKHGIYLLPYAKKSKTFYQTELTSRKDKYVRGLFQNRQYFESIREVLLREFEIKTPPSEQNERILEMISGSNSVCLHIRRGDYLNPQWAKLNICDFDYYQRAVNEVCRRTADPVFFVFSNTHEDIEWIRNNYHFTNPCTGAEIHAEYVDQSNPDYEEFRLMRACRHFIISSSTFSWWAAYLTTHADSVICAPDRWDLTLDADAGMNCPDWLVIPTGK